MSPVSRKEYVRAVVKRYHEVDRIEKSRILDEFCKICDYHRKHAITSLSHAKRLKRTRRKPGRTSRYNKPEIVSVLHCIWQTAHYPCSKRLKAVLQHWIKPYE